MTAADWIVTSAIVGILAGMLLGRWLTHAELDDWIAQREREKAKGAPCDLCHGSGVFESELPGHEDWPNTGLQQCTLCRGTGKDPDAVP